MFRPDDFCDDNSAILSSNNDQGRVENDLLDGIGKELDDKDTESEVHEVIVNGELIQSRRPVDDQFLTCLADPEAIGAVDSGRYNTGADIESDAGVIVIDSDGDDALATPKVVHKLKTEPGRRCGQYTCLGEDVAQIKSPTRWLSGPGLAVFAKSQWIARSTSTVQHFDSLVFASLQAHVDSEEAGDRGGAEWAKGVIMDKDSECMFGDLTHSTLTIETETAARCSSDPLAYRCLCLAATPLDTR